MYQPKISIIIASKNALAPLLQTLDNLHQQRYPKLEVIVVDGNSDDGTKEALSQLSDKVTRWVSERDKGISDAFNKGLNMATGDFINFQGAGDTLFSSTVLEDIFSDIDENVSVVCGRVQRLSEDGCHPLWVSPKHRSYFNPMSLLFKMALPHQALFVHRRFFERFGQFDNQYKFAMDYELLLRAYFSFPKTVVKNTIVANWRAGGVGAHRIFEIFDEYHAIKQKHKVATPFMLFLIDAFNRFKYLVKAKLLRMAY